MDALGAIGIARCFNYGGHKNNVMYDPNIHPKNFQSQEEYRNNMGIPGGSFTKREIFYSIIENDNLDDYWAKHCKSVKDDVLSVGSINKPYEDSDDAYLIYQVLKKKL